jgi:hypothetical protein
MLCVSMTKLDQVKAELHRIVSDGMTGELRIYFSEGGIVRAEKHQKIL